MTTLTNLKLIKMNLDTGLLLCSKKDEQMTKLTAKWIQFMWFWREQTLSKTSGEKGAGEIKLEEEDFWNDTSKM